MPPVIRRPDHFIRYLSLRLRVEFTMKPVVPALMLGQRSHRNMGTSLRLNSKTQLVVMALPYIRTMDTLEEIEGAFPYIRTMDTLGKIKGAFPLHMATVAVTGLMDTKAVVGNPTSTPAI